MKKISKIVLMFLVLLLLISCSNTNTSENEDIIPDNDEGTGIYESTDEEISNKMNADVVVVGSGLAGMSATVRAAQNGASVILIEKQGFLGGGILPSPGNMVISQVEENADYHIYESDDTLEDALERWHDLSDEEYDSGYPDYDRVSDLLVEVTPSLKWLEDMGATLIPNLTKEKNYLDTIKVDVPDIESGMGGAKAIKLMQSVAEKNGAEFYTNMKAESLMTEGDKVTGVIARSGGTIYEISAKSVILACGGFGANDELMAEYAGPINDIGYFYQGLGANTGDGIIMGKAVGADIYDEAWVAAGVLSPSETLIDTNKQFVKLMQSPAYTIVPDGDPIEGASSYYHLLVDKNGKRIGNEAVGRTQINDLVDAASAPYYVLYDKVEGELQEIIESGLPTGEVFKGDTIDDLANASGMNTETLTATVNKYNEAAISGNDSEYGKLSEYLNEIGNDGPYYLVRFVPSYVATYGGIKTNDNYQAIREDGTAIEGLYAIGENAIRFVYNRNYASGASNGFSLPMGHKAADHATGK